MPSWVGSAPAAPHPLCKAKTASAVPSRPVDPNDTEPPQLSSTNTAFSGRYGCDIDLRLSDCLGDQQPSSYDGFRFWTKTFIYYEEGLSTASVDVELYSPILSAVQGAPDEIRVTIDQPAWTICPDHFPDNYYSLKTFNETDAWQHLGLAFDGAGSVPFDDGGRALPPFADELNEFAPAAVCTGGDFPGTNCPYGNLLAVRSAPLATVDPCRLLPEGPVIDQITIENDSTLRVHTSAPLGDLSQLDLAQFGLSMQQEHFTNGEAASYRDIRCDGSSEPINALNHYLCDDLTQLTAVEASTVSTDANAFLLRFDGSVRNLCDDLDNPTEANDQLFAYLHPVLLDVGVKLHYLPSQDEPNRQLLANDGTPIAILDPHALYAQSPVLYTRNFRVSGANPYVECFPSP